MNKSYAPLHDYRVLDLTNVLSGPLCCQHLAFLGADVIKVENPNGGDLARRLGVDRAMSDANMGVSYLGQNAGKRSITLNLKHPDGKALLLKLVARADVLVENFRPGVMQRLGLDYQQLKASNPGIVYCAISGFGQTGPLRHLPAYDQIVQGMSGVMQMTGDTDSAPLRVGFPVADTIAGLTAGLAITAALAGRRRNNDPGIEGCMIDVSMLESTLATMGWVISNLLVDNKPATPFGNSNSAASPSGTFQTGHGLLNIAANGQRQFESLCVELGLPDLIPDQRFSDRYQRLDNRAALTELMEQALACDSAENWQLRLNKAGVPSGPVLSVADIFAHPQIRQRNLVQSFSGQSPSRVVRPGFLIDQHRPSASQPPPTLGQDTDQILGELGIDQPEINRLRDGGVI